MLEKPVEELALLHGVGTYRPRRLTGEYAEFAVGGIFGQHEQFRPAFHVVPCQNDPFGFRHGGDIAQGEKTRLAALAVEVGQVLANADARRDAQALRQEIAEYAPRGRVLPGGELFHGVHVVARQKRRELKRPRQRAELDIFGLDRTVLTGRDAGESAFIAVGKNCGHYSHAYSPVPQRNGHAQAGLPVETGEAFGRRVGQRSERRRAYGDMAEHGFVIPHFLVQEKTTGRASGEEVRTGLARSFCLQETGTPRHRAGAFAKGQPRAGRGMSGSPLCSPLSDHQGRLDIILLPT